MADKKISALTAATTPLAGTEVLPIVQGGNTVKVSVANLTAGRSISASELEVTGRVRFVDSTSAGPDLEFGNVGGGTYVNNVANARTYLGAYELVFTNYNNSTEWMRIDASGNVNAAIGNVKIGTAGKGIDFSANGGDVLSQYEEGTWTPVATGVTVNSGTPVWTGTYTRVGRMVIAHWRLSGGASVNIDLSSYLSLPFTALNNAWGSYGNASTNAFIGGIVAFSSSLYFGTAVNNLSSASGTITYQI